MPTTITAYQSLVEQDSNSDVHIRNNLLNNLGFTKTVGIPLVFPRTAQAQMTSLANSLTDVNVFELVKVRIEITCEIRFFGNAIHEDEVADYDIVSFESFAKNYKDSIISRMKNEPKLAPLKQVGDHYFPTPKAIDWLITTQPDFQHLKGIMFPGPIPSKQGAYINMMHVYDSDIISDVVNMTNPDQAVVIE